MRSRGTTRTSVREVLFGQTHEARIPTRRSVSSHPTADSADLRRSVAVVAAIGRRCPQATGDRDRCSAIGTAREHRRIVSRAIRADACADGRRKPDRFRAPATMRADVCSAKAASAIRPSRSSPRLGADPELAQFRARRLSIGLSARGVRLTSTDRRCPIGRPLGQCSPSAVGVRPESRIDRDPDIPRPVRIAGELRERRTDSHGGCQSDSWAAGHVSRWPASSR